MERITLPFKIRDVFQGFAECHGILSFDGKHLTFEYQTKDSIVGALQSEVKEICFSIDEIEEFIFKKNIFRRRLIIRVGNMISAMRIPNAESGEIRLSIARKHLNAALNLTSQVQLQLTDAELRRVQNLIDHDK